MIGLRPDPSCRYLLSWAIEVGGGLTPGSFVDNLIERGWTDTSRVEVLRQIVHPDGHELLFVPATGRLQLRLHYLIPKHQRRAVAAAIGAALSEITEMS